MTHDAPNPDAPFLREVSRTALEANLRSTHANLNFCIQQRDDLERKLEAATDALREIHGHAGEAKIATEKAWTAEGGESMARGYQAVCTAAHGFAEITRMAVAARAVLVGGTDAPYDEAKFLREIAVLKRIRARLVGEPEPCLDHGLKARQFCPICGPGGAAAPEDTA